MCFEQGRPEPATMFPFEEIYHALDGEPLEPADNGAEEFRSLLHWIWETPGDLPTARARFKALAGEALKSDPPADRGAAGFQRLIRYCFDGRRRPPETAWRIFAAVCATVNPALVGGRGQTVLANGLGCCKAAVSNNARDFREAFGWHFHEWRSDEGRENLRQARLRQLARS